MDLLTILAVLVFVVFIVSFVLILISDGDLSLMFLDKFGNKLSMKCLLILIDFSFKDKTLDLTPIGNLDNHFVIKRQKD